MRELHLFWQWGWVSVRLEYWHRWGSYFLPLHINPFSRAVCIVTPTPFLPQVTKLQCTLSFVTPRPSTVWLSTLMRTWSLSVPSVRASPSTCTCMTVKVRFISETEFVFSVVQFWKYNYVLLLHTVSQMEVHSIKAASRSGSTDTKLGRSTSVPPAVQDTPGSLGMDQFAQVTRIAMKMQCVREQLNSVLVNAFPFLLWYILHILLFILIITPWNI